jgi:predicted alpha/beta-hydrolase family hydrolase
VSETIHIPCDGFEVSATLHGAGATTVILAPGAGGSRQTPALLRLAESLVASGRRVLLHNFRYRDLGRRIPDPGPLLEATAAAVACFARERLGARRLVMGGRSMGGRIASQAVARGTQADALVFLAYPLHPPGKPETLRDRHLPQISVPMLFVSGTRDAFARWDLLQTLLERLGPLATLHAIEGGDHSFVVKRGEAQTSAQAEAALTAAVLGFLDRLEL